MNTLNKKNSLQSNKDRNNKTAAKQKYIAKPERKQADGKLSKHTSSSKYDKKQRNIQTEGNLLVDTEIQKAFSLHRKICIAKNETLQSLKYLGYSCFNVEHYQSFQKIWSTYHKEIIDITIFKEIYAQCQNQNQIQSYQQQFSLLSNGKSTLDLFSLNNAKESARCNGNIPLIMSQCSTDNVISYEQFSRIMHTLNTQT